MKIICYGCIKDEEVYFKQIEKELGVELLLVPKILDENNIKLANGCDAVSVLATSQVSRESMKKLADMGVQYVGTRCVGYNHMDIKAAKDYGIRCCNTLYSEHCVADFTLMLMLMCVRSAGYILQKSQSYDYTVNGMQGKEMPNLTIGIIGTGRIGKAVANRVNGFGSRILAYDLYPNDNLRDMVEYVSLEELYRQSDVITFHAPFTAENAHMFNRTSLEIVKDGVILINAARGELIDTEALFQGLDSGKIGSAGIDCFEEEYGVIQHNMAYDIKKRRDIMMLQAYPNVIFTPHIAFYTDQAMKDLVINGIINLVNFETQEHNPAEIK